MLDELTQLENDLWRVSTRQKAHRRVEQERAIVAEWLGKSFAHQQLTDAQELLFKSDDGRKALIERVLLDAFVEGHLDRRHFTAWSKAVEWFGADRTLQEMPPWMRQDVQRLLREC
jgi:hypothetical protein